MSLPLESQEPSNSDTLLTICDDENLNLNTLPSEILYSIIKSLHVSYYRDLDPSVFALLHVNHRLRHLTVRTLMGDYGTEWSEARSSLETATVLRSEVHALAKATQWSLNRISFQTENEYLEAYVDYFMSGKFGREYDLAVEAAREVVHLRNSYKETSGGRCGFHKARQVRLRSNPPMKASFYQQLTGWFSRSS